MEERILNIYKIGPRDVFHFDHSLIPFIIRGDTFVSVETDEVIFWEDLENTEFEFYEGEKVAVFGELSW